MEEIKCEQIGTIDKQGFNEMTGRVYSVDGLSPAMRTFCGGNQEAKIMVENNYLVYDGFNQTVKKDNDTCGTITRNVGADLKRNGQGIIEAVALDEQNGYLRQDGTVGTLTTDGSSPKHNNRVVEYDLSNCRFRKLTEKECGKLMGVLPQDIEKIAKNQSRSSQYHLYGDSIVTTVLMAWFGEMFGVDWKSKVDDIVDELTGG